MRSRSGRRGRPCATTPAGGFATARPPVRGSQVGVGGQSTAEGSRESREDLPEVFPSRDDLSDERDVFAGGDDDIDLDDDFDVPSFLK